MDRIARIVVLDAMEKPDTRYAVIERQGQDLKSADLARMIDNSVVDQLVREKYFEKDWEKPEAEEVPKEILDIFK